MAALSAGHLATDFANGSLPALLPFLVERFSLNYVLAATLMLSSTVSSSVIQPLFGLWSDRKGAMWLLPAGVALAGLGIALAADAPAYWLVAALVVVSGVGVAAYHPEGSKFAAYVSGRRRASGMALFSHRREHRLRARADRRDAARDRVRAARRAAACAPRASPCGRPALALVALPRRLRPGGRASGTRRRRAGPRGAR